MRLCKPINQKLKSIFSIKNSINIDEYLHKYIDNKLDRRLFKFIQSNLCDQLDDELLNLFETRHGLVKKRKSS